ncbi:MAG: TetR/AcrR family transcriptional regulator [Verrucomicrobiaceae bacterium]|nr:MAG: TetR/AcrR family transcriptional regulator [Verrucomicrobiaceae bacterium]
MQEGRELDPRVKRTRKMLFQALQELLEEKGFGAISMQDIAERSTLNRGTIYLHYKDKFALLEALIEEKFSTLLEARMKGSSGGCPAALRQLILAVSDFFGHVGCGCETHRGLFEPLVETAVRGVVRTFLLKGLEHSAKTLSRTDAELRATAASWAICGTVLEWSRTRSITADELADAVQPLVAGGLFLDEKHPSMT